VNEKERFQKPIYINPAISILLKFNKVNYKSGRVRERPEAAGQTEKGAPMSVQAVEATTSSMPAATETVASDASNP